MPDSHRITRAQAIDRAGKALARSDAVCAAMTPREQALAAWHPGGPDVDELERGIRARRAGRHAT